MDTFFRIHYHFLNREVVDNMGQYDVNRVHQFGLNSHSILTSLNIAKLFKSFNQRFLEAKEE